MLLKSSRDMGRLRAFQQEKSFIHCHLMRQIYKLYKINYEMEYYGRISHQHFMLFSILFPNDIYSQFHFLGCENYR